jgi:acetyl-CoA carboxylase biotin carboxyl carrier protein
MCVFIWDTGKVFMTIEEVKSLLRDVLNSDISEFELEHSGTRVRLKRGFGRDVAMISSASSQPSQVGSAASQPFVSQAARSAESMDGSEESALHIISSPIVGTAYMAPSPGTDPYVKLGDQVAEGTVLCLVEAMKLMNEIPSDIDGEIVRIYFENGRPVEFGQKLFGIRPLKQG